MKALFISLAALLFLSSFTKPAEDNCTAARKKLAIAEGIIKEAKKDYDKTRMKSKIGSAIYGLGEASEDASVCGCTDAESNIDLTIDLLKAAKEQETAGKIAEALDEPLEYLNKAYDQLYYCGGD